jgi:hypothetical protein
MSMNGSTMATAAVAAMNALCCRTPRSRSIRMKYIVCIGIGGGLTADPVITATLIDYPPTDVCIFSNTSLGEQR